MIIFGEVVLFQVIIICLSTDYLHSLKCTSEDHIKIVDSDEKVIECLSCKDRACGTGLELSPHCGSTVPKGTQVECKECKPGKYSSTYTTRPCDPCENCKKAHKDVITECTLISNTKCGNCSRGFYYDAGTEMCECCSRCCGDGHDEVRNECVKHGMPNEISCRVHNQKGKCQGELDVNGCPKLPPEPTEGPPVDPNTLPVYAIVIIASAILIVTLLAFTVWYSKRKGKRFFPFWSSKVKGGKKKRVQVSRSLSQGSSHYDEEAQQLMLTDEGNDTKKNKNKQIDEFIEKETLQKLLTNFTANEKIATMLEKEGVKNWSNLADEYNLDQDVKERLENLSKSPAGKVGEALLKNLVTLYPDEPLKDFFGKLDKLKRTDIKNAIKNLIAKYFLECREMAQSD